MGLRVGYAGISMLGVTWDIDSGHARILASTSRNLCIISLYILLSMFFSI